jgi:hypothetical protein
MLDDIMNQRVDHPSDFARRASGEAAARKFVGVTEERSLLTIDA